MNTPLPLAPQLFKLLRSRPCLSGIGLWLWLLPLLGYGQYVPDEPYCQAPSPDLRTEWQCASIHTVQFYAGSATANQTQASPIIPVGGLATLEFDELAEDARDFALSMTHCNADWTTSNYQPIEYMLDFPEVPITDFEFSVGTKMLYVHYQIALPRVKLSGNYLVKVYPTDAPDEPVLIRRLVAYENAVRLSLEQVRVTGAEDALRRQQLNALVNYGQMPLENPRTSLTLFLRQNQRWDNALELKPLFVRPLRGELDFRYFDLSNTFPAGHEYRAFDFTSFQINTLHVRSKQIEGELNKVFLYPDFLRAGMSYEGRWQDVNGRFGTFHRETGGRMVEPDYAWVYFEVASPRELPDPVYVIGHFSNYQPDEAYRMRYDPSSQRYRARILLKQGYYNYLYATYTNGQWQLAQTENNHFQTGNTYEALLYYRPFGGRGDRVLAYSIIN